jgi:hypothetical protein
VKVAPIKPDFQLPGSKRLKLKCDVLLSTSAFKRNLCRCAEERLAAARVDAGRETARAAGCSAAQGEAVGAYTRPLFSSTSAVSGTKYTLNTP